MQLQRAPWLAAALAGWAMVVLAAALLGCQKRPAASVLRPDDAQLVQRGAQLYQAQCASCHGARLEGQPNWREPGRDGLFPAPPHDPNGHTWHHPDELLFRMTKYGMARGAKLKDHKSAMPAYENVLSDEDIVAVLSWIKAQWPADVRERHDQINAAYAKSAG